MLCAGLTGKDVRADERRFLPYEKARVLAMSAQEQHRAVGDFRGSGDGPHRRCGAAVSALVEVPLPEVRGGTADTIEHGAQLLSLMARSPDIARRGDRLV
ncbi:hypothetical protein Stsp02_12210 [Streptomyces sp. NBRC 14336]|nr:hypothetical protein Stsp02_12210 [Streptomyces sp. NBRC 14336]